MGEVRHTLRADADQLLGTLRETNEALRDTGAATGEAAAKAPVLTKRTVAMGSALGALAASVAVATSRAIAYGDALGKMSERTGLSTEMLSGLEVLARKSDTSIETLAQGVATLSKGMADAAERGTGPVADGLRSLGISATDADGQLRSTDAVLADVTDALASMENGAEKAAAAQRLFGGSGRDLIPLLNQGADGMARAAAEASALGLVWSDDTSQAAEDFGDALTDLQSVGDGWIQTVAQTYVPALRDLARWTLSVTHSALGLRDAYEVSTAGLSDAELMTRQLAEARADLRAAAAEHSAAEEQIRIAVERGSEADAEAGRRRLAAAEQIMASARRRADAAKIALASDEEEQAALKALTLEVEEHAAAVGRGEDKTASAVETGTIRQREALQSRATEWDALPQLIRARQQQMAADEDAHHAERIARYQAMQDERIQLAEDSARQRAQIEQTFAQLAISIASQLTDAIGGELRRLNRERTADAQERRDREIGLAILMGEIQAGLAFATTLAGFPGGASPAAYAAAAAAAAAVGAATKISAAVGAARSASESNTFHDGGPIRPDDLGGRQEGAITVKQDEAVLNTSGVAAAGGEEGIAALNSGMGGMGGQVSIIRVGVETTEAIAHQMLRYSQGALPGALREVRVKVGRSMPGRR